MFVSASLLTSTHPSECSGLVPRCMRMPSRSGTSQISGIIFLNLGDHVILRGYVPAGIRREAFSSVGYVSGVRNGRTIFPDTPRPPSEGGVCLVSWIFMIVAYFVGVINSSSESACNMLRNRVSQGSCRASSSPQKLKFSGTPVSINIIDTH